MSNKDAARKSNPSRNIRIRYLEGGLRVLAHRGYSGLKLASVCEEVNVTTGSFYHAFSKWSEYTSALINYWRLEQSDRQIAQAREVEDPAERLDYLVEIAIQLPHASEAAIRAWSTQDPEVLAIQHEVDQERRLFIADTYRDAGLSSEAADRYATAAMYILVGFQNGTQQDPTALSWAFRSFVRQALAESEDHRREQT